jgi:hypothetical protein
MGLFGSGGLKSFRDSVSSIIASLVGQDIVARSITLTQVASSVAVQLVDGARLKLGAGTTDYLTSNGAAKITAAGDFKVTGTTQLDTVLGGGSGPTDYSTTLSFASSIAGISPTNSMMNIYPRTAVDADDLLLNVGLSDGTKKFNVNASGDITTLGIINVPYTDSSGTPGAATIDKISGRSAIALGAATVTITNATVVATSRVFISPRQRDATGLLPQVTTVGAGSFIVTTTAACTAALTFDWWVVNGT